MTNGGESNAPAEPKEPETRVDPGEGGLNLTEETTDPDQATPRVSATIEEKREDTRQAIAIALLIGLAVIAAAWTAVGVWGNQPVIAAAGNALQTIFTGVLGLTGTVVGFYFGGGGGRGSDSDKP